MIAGAEGWLEQLLATLRPADVLDIAVVALVAYALISWAGRLRSRFVFGGLTLMGASYAIARFFELHLTLFLFQLLITVALVGLLIIFQEDVRRGFERLASTEFRYKRRRIEAADLAGVLSLATTSLAKRRHGALMVLKGRDPLERHVSGGVPCDGRATEPLLESLFDPSSPGHDGAVILDGWVVTKFGVHLPLSARVSGGRELGTRHAAALGLSERCDALVVVVSEERGTISTAHEGKLEQLEGPGTLRQRLTAFLAWRSRRKPRPRWQRLVTARMLLRALAAAAIAIGGWVLLLGTERAPTTRTVSVPVVFRRMPTGWMIEEEQPRYVQVTLSGPSGEFRRLDPGELSAVVRAHELREGPQRVLLTPRDIEIPLGFEVQRIEPPSVRFVAHPLERVTAPVKPLLEGGAPEDYAIRTDPASVELVVPTDRRNKITVIRTEPIDVRGVTQPTTLDVSLWLPPGVQLADDTLDGVSVTIAPRPPPPEPSGEAPSPNGG